MILKPEAEGSGGNITEGDGHIWSGDRNILIGGGGYNLKDRERLPNVLSSESESVPRGECRPKKKKTLMSL